jgi:hypothetical protein
MHQKNISGLWERVYISRFRETCNFNQIRLISRYWHNSNNITRYTQKHILTILKWNKTYNNHLHKYSHLYFVTSVYTSFIINVSKFLVLTIKWQNVIFCGYEKRLLAAYWLINLKLICNRKFSKDLYMIQDKYFIVV